MPGEAEKAATLLGWPFENFKEEFLIREYWVGGAYVLAPRKVNQPNGFTTSKWMDPWKEADCIFLTGNLRCSIYNERPLECRITMGCDKQTGFNRDDIQKAWEKIGDPLSEGEEP